MGLPQVDSSIPTPSTPFPIMPTTCLMKCPTRNMRMSRKLRCGFVVSMRKSDKKGLMDVRKEPKKELSKILWTETAIEGIEVKAGSRKHTTLWPKAVLEALDGAIREFRWESALKIFELLRKQHWYEPRCRTYTKLLMMLGKCRKPDKASMLFDVLLSDGLEPTIDVHTALVNAYGLSGLFDKAFSAINDMKSVYDCQPDVHTYTVLINSCIKHRRFDLSGRVFEEMSYYGIECSTVAYNTLIDGYGKAGLFELMEKALSDMLESGSYLPDIFTLNSILWAYGNCGKLEEMEKKYEEFRLMGTEPDVRTFNILIRSYGKAKMYEKMESVIDFMRKRFFSPTVVTFNTIIEIYGRNGEIEKMGDIFLKMKHIGVKPNTVTYCSLVNAYSKAEKLYKLDSIIQQIENSDVVLDTPFFNCIISAYGRIGEVDKMEELFLAMREKNCKPDSITFATIIQAYNAKGMTEAARDMELKMTALQDVSDTKLIEG